MSPTPSLPPTTPFPPAPSTQKPPNPRWLPSLPAPTHSLSRSKSTLSLSLHTPPSKSLQTSASRGVLAGGWEDVVLGRNGERGMELLASSRGNATQPFKSPPPTLKSRFSFANLSLLRASKPKSQSKIEPNGAIIKGDENTPNPTFDPFHSSSSSSSSHQSAAPSLRRILSRPLLAPPPPALNPSRNRLLPSPSLPTLKGFITARSLLSPTLPPPSEVEPISDPIPDLPTLEDQREAMHTSSPTPSSASLPLSSLGDIPSPHGSPRISESGIGDLPSYLLSLPEPLETMSPTPSSPAHSPYPELTTPQWALGSPRISSLGSVAAEGGEVGSELLTQLSITDLSRRTSVVAAGSVGTVEGSGDGDGGEADDECSYGTSGSPSTGSTLGSGREVGVIGGERRKEEKVVGSVVERGQAGEDDAITPPTIAQPELPPIASPHSTAASATVDRMPLVPDHSEAGLVGEVHADQMRSRAEIELTQTETLSKFQGMPEEEQVIAEVDRVATPVKVQEVAASLGRVSEESVDQVQAELGPSFRVEGAEIEAVAVPTEHDIIKESQVQPEMDPLLGAEGVEVKAVTGYTEGVAVEEEQEVLQLEEIDTTAPLPEELPGTVEDEPIPSVAEEIVEVVPSQELPIEAEVPEQVEGVNMQEEKKAREEVKMEMQAEEPMSEKLHATAAGETAAQVIAEEVTEVVVGTPEDEQPSTPAQSSPTTQHQSLPVSTSLSLPPTPHIRVDSPLSEMSGGSEVGDVEIRTARVVDLRGSGVLSSVDGEEEGVDMIVEVMVGDGEESAETSQSELEHKADDTVAARTLDFVERVGTQPEELPSTAVDRVSHSREDSAVVLHANCKPEEDTVFEASQLVPLPASPPEQGTSVGDGAKVASVRGPPVTKSYYHIPLPPSSTSDNVHVRTDDELEEGEITEDLSSIPVNRGISEFDFLSSTYPVFSPTSELEDGEILDEKFSARGATFTSASERSWHGGRSSPSLTATSSGSSGATVEIRLPDSAVPACPSTPTLMDCVKLKMKGEEQRIRAAKAQFQENSQVDTDSEYTLSASAGQTVNAESGKHLLAASWHFLFTRSGSGKYNFVPPPVMEYMELPPIILTGGVSAGTTAVLEDTIVPAGPRISARDYKHGIQPLWRFDTIEDFWAGWHALRAGIRDLVLQAKHRPGRKASFGTFNGWLSEGRMAGLEAIAEIKNGAAPEFEGFYDWRDGLGMRKLKLDQNLHCFREGVMPLWEDKLCSNGGRWIISTADTRTDEIFVTLVLFFIGNVLPELLEEAETGEIAVHLMNWEVGPKSKKRTKSKLAGDPPIICGVSACRRPQRDKIEIWLGGHQRVSSKWAQRIKDVLVSNLGYAEIKAAEYQSFSRDDRPHPDRW